LEQCERDRALGGTKIVQHLKPPNNGVFEQNPLGEVSKHVACSVEISIGGLQQRERRDAIRLVREVVERSPHSAGRQFEQQPSQSVDEVQRTVEISISALDKVG